MILKLAQWSGILLIAGGQYSFPSSHAANHFGLAAFWFWSLYKLTGKKWRWLWIWASLMGYSQIYVGKHFPFDIIAGGLLGIIIGTMMARIFELYLDSKLPIPKLAFPFSARNVPNRF
jgi:undecaprenyl-diphosphatase